MARLCPHSVGTVISRQDAIDPNSLWPTTTWTETGQGRYPVGADSSHANGSTGDQKHSHQYGMTYGSYYGSMAMEDDANSGLHDHAQNNTWTLVNPHYMTAPNMSVNGNASNSLKTVGVGHTTLRANASYTTSEPPWFGVRYWKRTA